MTKSALFVALFITGTAMAATPCRDIPAGADGRKVQTFESLVGSSTKTPEQLSKLGSDLIYEGGSCPQGKICTEVIFATKSEHGQVVVMDKATGNVEQLLPLRFRNGAGDPARPIEERGVAPVNPARLQHICDEREKLFYPGARTDYVPGYFRECAATPGVDILDLYAYRYGDRTQVNPFGIDFYFRLGPLAKQGAIAQLNAGIVTKPGEFTQARSAVFGTATTIGLLSRVVGEVRRALGCEAPSPTPVLRLYEALKASSEGLRGCGLEFVKYPQSIRNLNVQNEGYHFYGDCRSRVSRGIETVKCETTTYAKFKTEFKIQNGRVIELNLKREKTATEAGKELTCRPVEPTTAPTTTPRPGASGTSQQ